MRPDRFPLAYPGDVRPLLTSEAFTRRMAKTCELRPGARVLVIGAAMDPVARVLSEELGARITRFDPTQGDPDAAFPFDDGAFDHVFVDVIPPKSFEQVLSQARRLLARNGMLCFGYPVRVGRHAHPSALGFWESRLGEPLRLPRECLEAFERSGYEPLLIEALDDVALDAFYRSVEGALAEGAPDFAAIREELALHRAQAGRASVTFAIMIGRRKEPGEKPPPSRHE